MILQVDLDTVESIIGHGCLHRAAGGGHSSTLAILVQAGANVDMVDQDQRTPVTMAALAQHLDQV